MPYSPMQQQQVASPYGGSPYGGTRSLGSYAGTGWAGSMANAPRSSPYGGGSALTALSNYGQMAGDPMPMPPAYSPPPWLAQPGAAPWAGMQGGAPFSGSTLNMGVPGIGNAAPDPRLLWGRHLLGG